jgi:hypothetical protein
MEILVQDDMYGVMRALQTELQHYTAVFRLVLTFQTVASICTEKVKKANVKLFFVPLICFVLPIGFVRR